MIHLYCGMGKGKTTAALGLCIRAAGSGQRVLFTQFFKNGTSSEMNILSGLETVEAVLPSLYYGRFKTMTENQKTEIRVSYSDFMRDIIRHSADYDMIILDEAVSAYMYDMLDRAVLLDFLRREGQKRELVLTGRKPEPELVELADYVTEMRKIKHPFDRGVAARRGVEF